MFMVVNLSQVPTSLTLIANPGVHTSRALVLCLCALVGDEATLAGSVPVSEETFPISME